mmetsp:Transcript_51538/g.120919  ORF Transcript_51538/g.120919 Transcript_51538/m.120919 type:complete len:85 (+) Transcript_51538:1-255(+)
MCSDGACLIHCSAGVSRSSSVVISYLMRRRGMSLREAYDTVKAARPQIAPNPGFWSQLLDLEMSLRGEVSMSPDEVEQCSRKSD